MEVEVYVVLIIGGCIALLALMFSVNAIIYECDNILDEIGNLQRRMATINNVETLKVMSNNIENLNEKYQQRCNK